MPKHSTPILLSLLLLLSLWASNATNGSGGIRIARHRREYEKDASTSPANQLRHGRGADFRFGRFQSLSAVKRAFDSCRSPDSFRAHRGKDGRRGSVCTTRLGGDWVLAESEQVAPSCTCEQVLRAYLDGRLQRRWSADKLIDVRTAPKRFEDGDWCYRQDLVLRSQRVVASRTGVMRYSQRITVDRIGRGNYCAFVDLDPEREGTPKKPFNSLGVYVGLRQEGEDVRIYAAGVFEVNRKVVPNLVVFDASGIAGDMAGKGTLWLSGHFEERKRSQSRDGSVLSKRMGQMLATRNRFPDVHRVGVSVRQKIASSLGNQSI